MRATPMLMLPLLLLRQQQRRQMPVGRGSTTRAGIDTLEGGRRGHVPADDWLAGDGAGRGKDPDDLAMTESAAEIGERAPRRARA